MSCAKTPRARWRSAPRGAACSARSASCSPARRCCRCCRWTARIALAPTRRRPSRSDPDSCEYWKHCAIDGFLCACCGGSSTTCPPGTVPSPISWIGTCHNPGDGRDYIVSYNDCCGKTSCGNCECNRNEREKPMYRPSRNNDLNWCMANANVNYHCTVSVILAVADK